MTPRERERERPRVLWKDEREEATWRDARWRTDWTAPAEAHDGNAPPDPSEPSGRSCISPAARVKPQSTRISAEEEREEEKEIDR